MRSSYLAKKEKDYVKEVNAKSLLIYRVARGTDSQVVSWRGKVDIIIGSLDDRKFYMGMDFLDKAKVIIVPYANTLFITDNK